MKLNNRKDRVPHPGRTAAQRKALDAIGCGQYSPPMSTATRDSLLELGLICIVGSMRVGRAASRPMTIPLYAMPMPVHMQWCEAVASDSDEPEVTE